MSEDLRMSSEGEGPQRSTRAVAPAWWRALNRLDLPAEEHFLEPGAENDAQPYDRWLKRWAKTWGQAVLFLALAAATAAVFAWQFISAWR